MERPPVKILINPCSAFAGLAISITIHPNTKPITIAVSVEVNAEQRYAKIHYEGADSSWIDLYVAERYMSTNPQFYMNVEDVMYQVYSGDEKESYQAESRERGPIEVKVFQSGISDAPVIEAYFAGHKGEEYVIQSYNIPQEDFNLIIENLRFEK